MYTTIIAEIIAENNAAPEWILLFAEGRRQLENGPDFLVDREAFDAVSARFERRGNDIVIDYEHQTLYGDKAPAAGWIQALRYTDGVGIEARVEWTEAAAEHIAQKEYRYFSPVFLIRDTDSRVEGVLHVALTNTPRINDLQPIAAKLHVLQGKEASMDFLKKLLAALGMAEDAGEEDALAEVAKIKAAEPVEVVAKEVLEALGMTDGDTSAVVASIHALKQQPRGMVRREEFEAVVAKLAQRDADEAVAAAMAAGKITPDQQEWAATYAQRDLDGFNAFVAKAPVVVPLGNLPKKPADPADPLLTDTTLTVAKLFGNSAEELKKYAGV